MELTLDRDDQDRIMYLCILDSKFLGQVARQKLKSSHFASEVRQKTFSTVLDFYGDYKKAPGIDILSEIESKIHRKRIRSEDKEMYEDYLAKIFSIPSFSEDLIKDRLDFFLKTRIITTLSNSLLKLQDYFTIDPDKGLGLARDAIIEADSLTGRKGVESILFDPAGDLKKRDFLTKFNIDPIDRQLGGGFKKANYVVIQAFLGMGKSWCVNHLAKIAVRFGNSPLVIHTEMSNYTAKIRYRMSFSGLTMSKALENPDLVKKHTVMSMNKGADIYLLSEEEKGMSVDELPAVVENTESKTGKKIDLILIDTPDDMLPPRGRYKNKIDESTAIHTFLKNFAKNDDKCIIVTTQAQRIGETKEWLGPSNVGDNINKLRKATVGISINGLKKEKDRHLYRLWLFKNTDGMEGARVWAKHGFGTGQFMTKYSRYDRRAYKDIIDNEPVMVKNGD